MAKGSGEWLTFFLGISGAFLVRFIMEQVSLSLGYVNLLLLSIWGAAAPPATVRLLLRRHKSFEVRIPRTTAPPQSRKATGNY